MKKGLGRGFIVLGIVIILVFIFYNPRISGDKILEEFFQDVADDIASVTLVKEIEKNGNLASSESRSLTKEQMEQFYVAFRDSEFQDIKDRAFTISTNTSKADTRYIFTFADSMGKEVIRMQFYGDRHLLLDRGYNAEKPSVYKRYRLMSTGLGDFFEKAMS